MHDICLTNGLCQAVIIDSDVHQTLFLLTPTQKKEKGLATRDYSATMLDKSVVDERFSGD